MHAQVLPNSFKCSGVYTAEVSIYSLCLLQEALLEMLAPLWEVSMRQHPLQPVKMRGGKQSPRKRRNPSNSSTMATDDLQEVTATIRETEAGEQRERM